MRDDEALCPPLDRVLERPAEVDDEGVHALCCAAWMIGMGERAWALFEGRLCAGRALDNTSYGFLWMDAAWRGQQARQLQVLVCLASGAVAVPLRRAVARFATSDGVADVMFQLERPLLRSRSDEAAWYRLQKLAALLSFIEATVSVGSPPVLLRGIEGFVKDDHHRWLKIAGGPKAKVVDAALHSRGLAPCEVCIEMGCFVGYTAIRFGWRVEASQRGLADGSSARLVGGAVVGAGVISMELEPVHICIARHHIDSAWLSGVVEVWPAHVPWATPRLLEQFGGSCAGFIFMDHKGTRFHEDLGDGRALSALAPWSRLLCDNVLKPGAPEHLWMHHRGTRSATIWGLHEFMEPDCEDWQSLRDDAPCRQCPARRR
eukprot:NODE_6322_length_1683_cov_2.409383.p1 GENE.NODE_6322_length_1683_cov_2.409383~~NODE_6322_length_1683_cov_2.409383.p1  ORF type:complete len:375 (+),score=68.55 NODE_6322_length_1683_cov_2.409383:430-1554(+)